MNTVKAPWLIHLYRWVFPLLLPFVVLRLWVRSLKNPAYRQRIAERFGRLPFVETTPVVWVHAVSLGESVAVTPLIRRCLAAFPKQRVLVTTTTPTGSQHIVKTFGETVRHAYLPYDTAGCFKRFFKHVTPQVLVVAETELWPLLFEQCHLRGIPILIVNGRISDDALTRYVWITPVTRWLLSFVRQVIAQSVVDGERFVQLGLPRDRLTVMGNLKFDVRLAQYPAEVLEHARTALDSTQGRRLVWVAASTNPGEEKLILDAYRLIREQIPNLRLVIVPRHPERFDEVAQLITQQPNGAVARRSRGEHCTTDQSVYLADTMGELALFYQVADMAFVGGSLVPIGGHNPLEPVMAGLPVVMGPYTQNARDSVALLKKHGILTEADSVLKLSNLVTQQLLDESQRQAIRLKAQTIIQEHQGTTDKVIATVTQVL